MIIISYKSFEKEENDIKGKVIEQLKDLLKNIFFTHVYFQKKQLNYITKYRDMFANYSETNLSSSKIKRESGSIIFIELPNLTKESFKILNLFVKHNKNREIYIFTPEHDNILLLKFVIHFSLNKIYPINIDDNEIKKILISGSKKHIIKLEEKRDIEISKALNSIFPILIFKDKNLIFANTITKTLFGLDSTIKIEKLLSEDKELIDFLTSDEKRYKFILQTEDEQEWEYLIFKETLDSINKIITMIPIQKIDKSTISVADRFEFLEDLKDKLAQCSVSNSPISLIIMNIANYKKLLKTSNTIELHEFMKKFLTRLYFNKKSHQKLTQWDTHTFILTSLDDEESTKNDLDTIHQKLIHETEDINIKPIITSSWLNIKELQLDEIIKDIDIISSRKFENDTFDNQNFYELNHLDNFLDESEQIKHYLQSCIGNKTVIKLLNIYKGLCINTKSKILRIKDESYFVHCESLQGYSMQFDDKTVIQTPDLPKDIEADVIYVDIDQSYAVLENLKFLETSANNRQHTRVQPSIRTPIMIKHNRYSYQGDILDISTNAIAIKLNRLIDEDLKNLHVELKFKLPDEDEDVGFVYMEVEGTVIYINEIDSNKTKLVVNLNLERPYDSYLLKYMYQRQKELILELKRAVKLHT